jgi:hypothetical protein
VKAATTMISFAFDGREFKMAGSYDFQIASKIAAVMVLGLSRRPEQVRGMGYSWDAGSAVATVTVHVPLTEGYSFSFYFIEATRE